MAGEGRGTKLRRIAVIHHKVMRTQLLNLMKHLSAINPRRIDIFAKLAGV